MSEPENFLERWSRRKRDAIVDADPKDEIAAIDKPAARREATGADAADPSRTDPSKTDPSKTDASKTDASKDETPQFDVSQLPSLDSIDANSDLRAFLQPGVPSDLKHAALRRAWSADAGIRDFIGLVENGGDFNDPNGMPGFGPLAEGENIAKLVARVLGAPNGDAAPATSSAASDGSDLEKTATRELANESGPVDDGARNNEAGEVVSDSSSHAATQDAPSEVSDVPKRRRGHGGALPV